MLKFKGNYLSTAGIRFALPENFYIDIEGMEAINPDGLRLVSPEKDCSISFVTTEIEYESTVASLMDIFMDDVLFKDTQIDFLNDNETGYKWHTEPQQTNLNGLGCACIKYETPRSYYYEIHFNRIKGFDRQLEILLSVSKEFSTDLDTVLNRENIQDFYNSISLDKE